MPGKLLGLDIKGDSVTAVQVKSGLKGYEITACARVGITEGGTINDALGSLFDQIDIKNDSCIVSVPGEHISYNNLQLPFKDNKKIRQILAFEIETMVPFSIDDIIVDFIISDISDESDILAVSVKKEFLSEYLSNLQANGIEPDIIDINCMPIVSWILKQEGTPDDGLFLEIDEKRINMVVYLKRHIVLIRTISFNCRPLVRYILAGTDIDNNNAPAYIQIESCFKSFCRLIQNTIHSFKWESGSDVSLKKIYFTGIGALYPETDNLINKFLNIPAEYIDLSRDKRIDMNEDIARIWNPAVMDTALALALRDSRHGMGFNFRKDEFEIKRHYFGFKKELQSAAIFLIIILFFWAGDMGVDYNFLQKRYRILEQKITEVFRETLPGVTRIVDPLQQIKVKISEIKKSSLSYPGINSGSMVLDVLRDVSKRIDKSLGVYMTRIVIDPETVRISGRADSFNTVDSMKNGLESSAYYSSVTISSANIDKKGKQVQFEIKMQRKH